LKYTFKIFFFLVFFISTFGFAQSNKIITTKKEAEKKGIYTAPSVDKAIAYNEPLSKNQKKEIRDKEKKSKKIKAILNTKNAKDIIIDNEETDYVAEQLINNVIDNVGVDYSYGGTSKDGFDCSGLLYSTFKKFDIDIPRVSSSMADIGKKMSIDNAEKGDLIFFATAGGNRITHVGMITEVNGDEILFVHASTSAGVIVSSLSETYYQNTFVQINKIL
jgi:cell wall-associated NlpC family hydrolase